MQVSMCPYLHGHTHAFTHICIPHDIGILSPHTHSHRLTDPSTWTHSYTRTLEHAGIWEMKEAPDTESRDGSHESSRDLSLETAAEGEGQGSTGKARS